MSWTILWLALTMNPAAGSTCPEPPRAAALAGAASDGAVATALHLLELRRAVEAAPEECRLGLLERFVALEDRDGRVWRDLAKARTRHGDTTGAARAWERAMALGEVPRGNGECSVARLLAPIDPDSSAAALERCLLAGTRDLGRLLRDPAIGPLLVSRPGLRGRLGSADVEECRRGAGWALDLQHLIAEIRRVHWHYRDRDLPDEFRAQVTELEARLGSLADAEIVVELQRIVAGLGDGHSVVYPIGMQRGALARLPIGYWWFEDGLYVVAAEAPNLDLIGRQVVRIGQLPVAEVLEGLRPLVSRDNDSGFTWVAPVYLVFEELIRAAGATPANEITVRRRIGGEEETRALTASRAPVDPSRMVLSLPPPPGVAPPLAWSRPGEAMWLASLGPRTLYVKLDRIGDDRERSLARFADELSRRIEADGIESVVLDLRHNPGGDAALLPPLLRTLIGFAEASAARRLYVLTSRNTFSAAQTLLGWLEWLTGAVIVGEPPGTRPNRRGNEAPFRLPCSGVLGTLAAGWNQTVTSRDDRVWIPPDIPVRLTAEAYFAGADPVMDVITTLVTTD